MPKASGDTSPRTFAENMTTIATFTDAIRADFAASYLQSRDVAAVLADRDAASYIGASNLVPIRLQVPENKIEEAMTILKDLI